jgi:hypothetical protein
LTREDRIEGGVISFLIIESYLILATLSNDRADGILSIVDLIKSSNLLVIFFEDEREFMPSINNFLKDSLIFFRKIG